MNRLPWLLTLILLVFQPACHKQTAGQIDLDLGEILGGQNTDGFKRAFEPREFHFPEDHAAHPGFRNEWWYLTGNLADDSGRYYGYQVTFFRTAITPAYSGSASAQVQQPHPGQSELQSTDSQLSAVQQNSSWTVSNVWMGHAAITDIDASKHYAEQRFSRADPGLAGAQINPVRIWLEDWQFSSASNDFPWYLKLKAEDFSFELDLRATREPLLQGAGGLSQKSSTPGNASYYYSYTRMETSGRIGLNEQFFDVQGLSWFDREWSTSSLDDNQIGWNWFSLQFENGEDLMYYQLLDRDGKADANSQGKWVSKSGESTAVSSAEIKLKVLDEWLAGDGNHYPVRWKMDFETNKTSWIIAAPVADQYMDLAVKYWEGAVIVYAADSGELVGRGFLEMTRTQ